MNLRIVGGTICVSVVLSVGVTSVASKAFASSALADVCTLATIETSALRATPEQIAEYKIKINNECELSMKHRQMIKKAHDRYGITLDQISQYQAMRYIRREAYEASKAKNVPVELTYQLLKSDYEKPLHLRSSIIWDNFILGLGQLPAERNRVQGGANLGLNDILRLQRGFFKLSLEIGDMGHDPQVGRLRSIAGLDPLWWKIPSEQLEQTKSVIEQVNQDYAGMGLIPSKLDGLFKDSYLTEVLSVKPAADGDGLAVFRTDTRASEQHLLSLFKFINTMLDQAQQSQHMIWKGQLMTPGEIAYFSQQFFVQVHALVDGNGRMSRMLQEILLASFELPPGSSGDLMDSDVVTRNPDYYNAAMQKSRELLQATDACLESVYPEGAKIPGTKTTKSARKASTDRINLLAIDPSRLTYDCRLLGSADH